MSTPQRRSYVAPTVCYRNPRQREVWEMQSTHQSRLNYLHFLARLDGTRASSDDSAAHDRVADAALLSEEAELAATLRRERHLLEESRASVAAEVDQIKGMLEGFRQQRAKRLAEKQRENGDRAKSYDEELRRLRRLVTSGKSDIRVAIRKVEWDGSGEGKSNE
jgi:hypothetical protein